MHTYKHTAKHIHTHKHLKQSTKDNKCPEVVSEYHVQRQDFMYPEIVPWNVFIKDYMNSSDHKHLMRQQGVQENYIIHLIYRERGE